MTTFHRFLFECTFQGTGPALRAAQAMVREQEHFQRKQTEDIKREAKVQEAAAAAAAATVVAAEAVSTQEKGNGNVVEDIEAPLVISSTKEANLTTITTTTKSSATSNTTIVDAGTAAQTMATSAEGSTDNLGHRSGEKEAGEKENEEYDHGCEEEEEEEEEGGESGTAFRITGLRRTFVKESLAEDKAGRIGTKYADIITNPRLLALCTSSSPSSLCLLDDCFLVFACALLFIIITPVISRRAANSVATELSFESQPMPTPHYTFITSTCLTV